MDEIDEDELFTVCLDDDGHPVLRTVADMTAGEVIAAIDHLTVEAAGRRVAVHEKLPGRRIVIVGDTALAAIGFLAAVRGYLSVVTRLRLDANLFAPAPQRASSRDGVHTRSTTSHR